jgi:hypothetical protein
MFYSTFLAIMRLLIAMIYTSMLFRTFKINVNPLHPDGSAGLGVVENMVGISAAFITSTGAAAIVLNSTFLSSSIPHLAAVSTSALQIWEAIIIGIVYIILAPTLIVGWLLSPHQAMQEALDNALLPLANQFQSTITGETPSSTDDASKIKQGTDRLAELKRRYDLLQETFPVWPIQIQQIRRIVATVSLPAVITFLVSLPEVYNRVWPFILSLFHR